MNWRRGLVRLGIGATLWWFLFWTCAYAISPNSENAPAAAVTVSGETKVALGIIAIADFCWVVAGFRRN